jgi:orotate phosphoribosyltransferase
MLAYPDALLAGHFELLSGLHTDRFLAFSRIAADTAALNLIADYLLPSVAAQGPTVIVAPSTAGVALAWALAQRLSLPLHLAGLDDRGRAHSLIGGPDLSSERALLVNDILTTGHGLQALADTVTASGAELAAAAWFLTRSSKVDVEAMIGAPGFPVATMPLSSWAADQCPHCQAQTPAQLAVDLN